MNKLALATTAIIALLALVTSSCATRRSGSTPTPLPPTPTATPTPIPPTPTPEVSEPNYTDLALGFSLWYPEGWVYEEQPDGVIFGTSEQLISGQELDTGAVMAVLTESLGDGETVERLIETALDELYFDDMETGEPESRAIGGDQGIIVSLQGKPQGTDVKLRGFLAATQGDGTAYIFLAFSVADEWSEYYQTLEKMLCSVQVESAQKLYTNPTLGVSLWYPPNWVYDEGPESVLFGTSEQFIDGDKLESGAGLMLMASSLEQQSLEEWFEELASQFTFDDGGLASKPKPQAIGGQTGLSVDLKGVPEGAETVVKGFIAAVEYEGWGYFFLAVSVADEWCDHGPVLQEMLHTVEFIE